MSLSGGDRPRSCGCSRGTALFPWPERPPRGSRESRGSWGAGRPRGTPESGAPRPERTRKMLENTLKRSKCGRREASWAPTRWDRGRGSTRPAPGLAPAPAVPAVTQDGQSGARAGEPEKRGRDPRAAPSPSLAPSSPPSRPPPGPVDVAGEPVAQPVPGPAVSRQPAPGRTGKGNRVRRGGGDSCGARARPPLAALTPLPILGHPWPAVARLFGPGRTRGRSAAPVSPRLFSRLREGTVAAHIWAALGAAREQPPKGNAEGSAYRAGLGGDLCPAKWHGAP